MIAGSQEIFWTSRKLPESAATTETSTRDYISYSALLTYRQCPLRYYFKYVEGLPETMVSASLVFGGAIHAAIEEHYRHVMAGCQPPRIDQLVEVYHSAFAAREGAEIQFGSQEDRDGLGQLAGRMLQAFQQSDLAQPTGTILAIEEELRGAIIPGCPDVLARIDLLVEQDDQLLLRDFKTSRSRWTGDQAEDAAEQLLLYADLVRPLAPGKQLSLEFAVLTKAKEPVVSRHLLTPLPAQIERTKCIAHRVWQSIQAGHFFPAPSPLNCPGCPFRRPCRAWRG